MLGKDRIERRVARNASERDMRHRPTVERQPLAVGLSLSVDTLDPGPARVARHVLRGQFTELEVVKLRGHQAMLRERERYPACIDGDPAPPPVLGNISGSAAATGRIEHQVARVSSHQHTSRDYLRRTLDNIYFRIGATLYGATDVMPQVSDGGDRKILFESSVP